jgi:RHS repeat-associated protein
VSSASATQVVATVPNGAITGTIELTHVGGTAATATPFTVDTEQDFQLTVAPSAATAVQGSAATYIIYLTSQQTTFSQLASLTVTGLPNGITASFNPSQITAGASSTLTLNLSGNLAPSGYPFTIHGVASVGGNNLEHTVGATLNVMSGGQTTLSGRVLSTDKEPIIGATASLDGRTAMTDAAGAFLLTGVTAGTNRPLMIDGRTASSPNRTYPVIIEPANIVAGRANVVPYTFYLPPIDTQYEVEVVPGQNTVATNPRVPGLQMTIPAGANLRNRDGSPVTRVSITPLAIDRTPAPLPSNVSTAMVYTSQPGGALSDLPLPVVYPNLMGTNPGTRVNLYAFNHDTVQWYIYGTGTVSSDGRTIVPDINPSTGNRYGLPDFSWHFPDAAPDGNPHPCDDDDCEGSCTENTVDLSTGVKLERTTDVAFSGTRGGLTLERIHTSDLPQSCDSCPFGRGTTHNYMMRLSGSFGVGGAGRYIVPGEATGRLFSYTRTDPDGTLVFTTRSTTGQLGDLLRKLSDGSMEYRKADGSVTRFDSSGKPIAMIDRNNNVTTLAYSGSSLASVTDPVGRSLTFVYDGSSRITSVTDSSGRAWRYTYEGTPGTAGSPGLTTVTDPLGNVMRYTYSIGGRLSSVVDKRGVTVKQITYDGNGRVVRQEYADGGFEQYDYILSGRLVTSVTHTDQLGHIITKRFSAGGYLVGMTDELGQTSKTDRDINSNLATSVTGPCGCQESVQHYDERGNVTSVTNRLGQSVGMEYEPVFNNVVKMTDKLNRVTTYSYDTHGNLTSMTDALNQTTTFVYNQYGQLTSVTDPLNHTTQVEYDAYGNISAQVDGLNHRTTFENDALGRQTAVIDAEGRRSSKTFDALDRVLTSTHSSGAVTRYGYDAEGNLVSVTNADERSWTTQFDPKGHMVSETDPLGRRITYRYDVDDRLIAKVSPTGRTLRYGYDARGNVASITDALGNVVQFTYNNRNKLASLKDQRGSVTTFTYDELYRPIATTDPLGRISSVSYDVAGNATESIDRLGRHRVTTYDALNRPVQTTFADAIVNYAFDAASRLTGLNDSQAGTISWDYDAADRLTTETSAAGTVRYEYNSAGQRTKMTAGNRPPVIYGYDVAGRLQTIAQGAEVFTHTYDTLSRQAALQRPNGVTTSYTYDAINRPMRILHSDALGQALEDYHYTYNLDGEIDSITSLASAQLLSVSKTIGGADQGNRISQFGSTSMSFDDNGQTTSKTDAQGTTTYHWDSRGRLTQVALPDGRTVGYGYDPIGRRTSRSIGGATTNFLYDGIEVVLDSGSDGSLVDYLNGGETDGKLRQGSGLYFLQDHLGSISALTDASGSVVQRMQYDAFGDSPGSAMTSYGFTGRDRDEVTGLFNLRARWYDPQQGRFISEDPIGMAGGYNEYAYVRNDPVNLTDPFGLQDQNPWQKPPDPTKDRTTYNCVGLACRTYENQPDVEKYKNDYLSKGRKLKNCAEKCKKCEIKHWLWEYEIHITDEAGNDTQDPHHDFHTVAGQTNCKTGADPTNVYSKNGPRPIHGPGTGGSFRPPDRERVTDANDQIVNFPDGSPAYKVRKDMVESCYCMPKPKK